MATEQKTLKIRSALSKLDPENEKHWTDDGLPRESVVRNYSGDSTLSRKDISDAWPGLQRSKPQGDQPGDSEPEIDPITGDPVATLATEPRTPAAPPAAPAAAAPPAAATPGNGRAASGESLETPETNTGEVMTEDEVRDLLEARVRAAERRLGDAQQAVREANRAVEDARTALQDTRNDLTREFPPLSQADNVKQFIASEQAMRAHRLGIGAMPSRIDVVMQRSNSRGWRRPSRIGQTQTSPTGTGVSA